MPGNPHRSLGQIRAGAGRADSGQRPGLPLNSAAANGAHNFGFDIESVIEVPFSRQRYLKCIPVVRITDKSVHAAEIEIDEYQVFARDYPDGIIPAGVADVGI